MKKIQNVIRDKNPNEERLYNFGKLRIEYLNTSQGKAKFLRDKETLKSRTATNTQKDMAEMMIDHYIEQVAAAEQLVVEYTSNFDETSLVDNIIDDIETVEATIQLVIGDPDTEKLQSKEDGTLSEELIKYKYLKRNLNILLVALKGLLTSIKAHKLKQTAKQYF
jgi:hypothetical protein